MTNTFKQRMRKGIVLFLGGFLLLFIFRLAFSFTEKGFDGNDEYRGNFFDNFASTRKNIASDKFEYGSKTEAVASVRDIPSASAVPQKSASIEQKYEKVATLKSKTDQYEKSENDIRQTIKDYKAIIQVEDKNGNPGNRQLNLSIGVPPTAFDTFVSEVRKIGKIKSCSIQKTDKTSEFKNLNAKKNSLETTRTSLIELKKQTGKIEEFINLQNRILDIEQQLQDLGVALGDFSEENEFCTVNFSLYEGRFIRESIMHKIKMSIEWTCLNYLNFLLVLVVTSVLVFFILLIIDKLKIFSGIINKFNS
jgi:hypothetical protein